MQSKETKDNVEERFMFMQDGARRGKSVAARRAAEGGIEQYDKGSVHSSRGRQRS